MSSNREAFFEHLHNDEFMYMGYDDIQLRTELMSEVDLQDVSIRGRVAGDYFLRNPIIGAAMNCVSEDRMAIAMGLEGAGAIVHHANTPEEQAAMVKNVKNHLHGIIDEPVVAKEGETVEDVQKMLINMGNKGFKNLPVLNNEGRCTGLLDKASFYLYEPGTKVTDAMRPFGEFPTAPAGISPDQAYDLMRADHLTELVLVDTERRLGGLCLVKDIARMKRSNPLEYSLDENGRLITLASVSTRTEDALERLRLMVDFLDIVVVDTSHGEHKHNVDTVRAIKDKYGDRLKIVSGNISTEQASREIAKLEPDAISAGQGPGQICVSSDRLGFGTPQASAVYEVAKGAHAINPNIAIIADGGIKDSADTMKAFALGATAVKVGGLIAGTDETPVPIKYDEVTRAPYKEYWGMGSERAQRAFAAARERYGHYAPPKDNVIFIEGFEKRVPLKGPVANVIKEHVLGVKLSMMAQGVTSIEELYENARFMRGANRKT